MLTLDRLYSEGLAGASEAHCFATVQVCRMRIAKLTAAGAPLTGSTNGYTTDALISARVRPQIEAGKNVRLKNGCGNVVQQFRDCDRLVSVDIELELSQLDSQLIAFMTGGSAIVDLAGAGLNDIIGYEVPGITDSCPNGVSLEMWSKAWDDTEQATPPFGVGGTTVAYFHWVFPRTKWRIGDLTLEDDIARVPLVGYGEENTRLTGNGPFDDWPSDIAARGGMTNLFGWFLDTTALPAATCDPVNVSSAAS